MVKNPPANAGDIREAGSIPGWRRSPGEGNGNPLQYSCLENPMDKGAWWATVRGVAKSQTWLKRFSTAQEDTYFSRRVFLSPFPSLLFPSLCLQAFQCFFILKQTLSWACLSLHPFALCMLETQGILHGWVSDALRESSLLQLLSLGLSDYSLHSDKTGIFHTHRLIIHTWSHAIPSCSVASQTKLEKTLWPLFGLGSSQSIWGVTVKIVKS